MGLRCTRSQSFITFFATISNIISCKSNFFENNTNYLHCSANSFLLILDYQSFLALICHLALNFKFKFGSTLYRTRVFVTHIVLILLFFFSYKNYNNLMPMPTFHFTKCYIYRAVLLITSLLSLLRANRLIPKFSEQEPM